MSQLKPSYVSEIKEALSQTIFSLQDFLLEFPEDGAVLLKIVFKHVPSYSFSVREDSVYEEVPVMNFFSGGNQTKTKLVRACLRSLLV